MPEPTKPRGPVFDPKVVKWVVQVNRGVLGISWVSKIFDTRQQAEDHLAQFGPSDGYVQWV